ncbi:MAG: integrase catalytic domain-containing protein, partial [Bacteroidetes bacterium]|nr:integrase catalytic domain-containing protein [Bacteroidota bacterium]
FTQILKVIRRIINEAINEDLLPFEKNPFHRFKLKTEKTNIEYLTEKELKLIEELDLVTRTKMDIHRDMYVFAAYTGGIRISDIIQLKWKNFDGERIYKQAQKTGEIISIKVPRVGLTILEKYKQKKGKPEDFIFPILKNDVNYSDPKNLHRAISSSTAYVNKNLKIIAEATKITKRLHFHTSRHTFATSAIRKGMRFENASKILGHTNMKTTQIYAKIVNEELDKAMEIFN